MRPRFVVDKHHRNQNGVLRQRPFQLRHIQRAARGGDLDHLIPLVPELCKRHRNRCVLTCGRDDPRTAAITRLGIGTPEDREIVCFTAAACKHQLTAACIQCAQKLVTRRRQLVPRGVSHRVQGGGVAPRLARYAKEGVKRRITHGRRGAVV